MNELKFFYDFLGQIGFKVVHPNGEKIFCMYCCCETKLSRKKINQIHSVKLEISDNGTMIRKKSIRCGDYRWNESDTRCSRINYTFRRGKIIGWYVFVVFLFRIQTRVYKREITFKSGLNLGAWHEFFLSLLIFRTYQFIFFFLVTLYYTWVYNLLI